MKKQKDYTLILLAIIFLMACLVSCDTKKQVGYFKVTVKNGKYVAIVRDVQHICTDSTHINCDGNCSCDGMECIK